MPFPLLIVICQEEDKAATISLLSKIVRFRFTSSTLLAMLLADGVEFAAFLTLRSGYYFDREGARQYTPGKPVLTHTGTRVNLMEASSRKDRC